MTYKVELSKLAEKTLRQISQVDQKLYSRFVNVIESLKENPFSGKKLSGILKDRYSVRIGQYRMLYKVEQNRLIVYIIDLGHRKDIYR